MYYVVLKKEKETLLFTFSLLAAARN